MKKIIALLLAVLFVFSLAACSSAQPQYETEAATLDEAGDAPVAGGWSVSQSDASVLPDEVQTAFDKATAEYTGMSFVPVAYIGKQVVAGMNYAILCEGTTVTADPETSLKVVIIYSDPEGSAQITNVEDFDLTAYTQSPGKTQSQVLSGGWSAPDEVSQAPVSDEAKNVFDKATETFEGNILNLMALLGSRVVSGTDYAFLCHSTIASAEPAYSMIRIVTVHQDPDGMASITNICNLDAADFNQ